MTSLRFHEPGELRLGEGQQRADCCGFDVEHPCHGVRFDPFVTEPQGDRVALREGMERLGSIHVLTMRIGLPERIGSALPIFRGHPYLPIGASRTRTERAPERHPDEPASAHRSAHMCLWSSAHRTPCRQASVPGPARRHLCRSGAIGETRGA